MSSVRICLDCCTVFCLCVARYFVSVLQGVLYLCCKVFCLLFARCVVSVLQDDNVPILIISNSSSKWPLIKARLDSVSCFFPSAFTVDSGLQSKVDRCWESWRAKICIWSSRQSSWTSNRRQWSKRFMGQASWMEDGQQPNASFPPCRKTAYHAESSWSASSQRVALRGTVGL